MRRLTHKSSWVGVVSPNFSIDFYKALVENFLALIVCQSVLQTVTQEHHERKAFTQLVWSCAGSGGLNKTIVNKFVTSVWLHVLMKMGYLQFCGVY